MSAPAEPAVGAWAPLRRGLFLAFWLANLASLIGTWVQEVGAAWLMTTLTDDPLPVALIQSAASLPVLVLALPAGALADVFDRRRLLLVAQGWMLLVALALGLLTLGGAASPALLLASTLLLGVGAALNAPVWQAVLPELVDDAELPAAVALGSVGFNVARAVGPALGGALVAAAGPGIAFLVNAGSFLGVLGVVALWRRPRPELQLPPETVLASVIGGLRYVRHEPAVRAVLVRVGAFMLCGSALWSLLPVIAKQELQVGALAYGLLLGSLGLGAVLGALGLAQLRERTSTDALVAGATVVLAGVVLTVAHLRSFPALCAVLLVGGAAWLALLSSFNTAVQTLVAAWVRGRAVALYLLVFAGGASLGGLGWGVLASRASSGVALSAGAAGLIGGLILIPWFRLPRARPEGLAPAQAWQTPPSGVNPGAGPVVVSVDYRVATGDVEAFRAALVALRQARLRTGAFAWALLEDLDEPGRFVEQFQVATWGGHLHQHERVSHAEQALQTEAEAFHQGPERPQVRHLLLRR
ncbi:MAG: MFS transporter [Planctomycetota bacterium]